MLALAYATVAYAFVFPQNWRECSPTYVWLATAAFMIRTFLFHGGLCIAVGAACAVAARRWKLALASVPLLIVTIGPDVWASRPRSVPAASHEPVRVTSVNLFAFNQASDGIILEVLAANPDILVLQEYTPHSHAAFEETLGDEYPHRRCVVRRDCFGVAVYSRKPLIGQAQTNLDLGEAGTPQLRTVVQIGSRAVALYNVHLMPPKGLNATVEQRAEFADLFDRLAAEELPIILCGDFNFTNRSAYADDLERLGLIDAHRISGRGRGATWPAIGRRRFMPGVRIDHIFLSRELTSTTSGVVPAPGSDHRAIYADVGLAPPE